ncbi:ribosomal protein S18-alanine N-acetyltransferase [Actinokineospora enzanensis]|uniref:ribosomal protein S18-alanine N-acetyltransferase n=1 Tax=Actinokineospora enzanensis TaxID=155975 RepID=UPI00036A7F67|nr:ribosomal protein S18-alanine N-acetyltransferase [Actinokineospora enzanensis]
MTVRIAPLRRADLRRCAELERVLFPGEDPWSESAFAAELDWGHHYVGAFDGELLVGYAGLSLVGAPGDMEASVHTLGVDPVWQRKGVGRALLRTLLTRADEARAQVFLEVRTDNAAAITLYEAHGFATVGLRRRYYQPSGADAYTMARPARLRETVPETAEKSS